MTPAYFDYAASNPIDPRVREAVEGSLTLVGNPSSAHSFGRQCLTVMDRARGSVAGLLGAELGEIVFTSGATEANSMALWGHFRRLRELYGPSVELRLAVSPLEHASVRTTVARLESELGVTVDRIPVDADGVTDMAGLSATITPATAMVCVMWANNVIGSLQPMSSVGEAVVSERRRRGPSGLPILLMTDAVQAMRTEEVRPCDAFVDLMAVSGHKFYAPKGIGVLYVRRGVDLSSPVAGGGQESGRRGGTENLSGIVGLGTAAELLVAERQADRELIKGLTSRLRSSLRGIGGLTVYGDPNQTVPGIVFFVVNGVDGGTLALKLDSVGFAVSTGSACDAGRRKVSPTLESICSGQALRHGGIRVSIGRFTTESEVEGLVSAIRTILGR
ncbi:cysteine desulfurase NifS [Candidatus Uhrbacteria bacterium CG_4_10_14_0_8_um_filter_58_22]|uniref:cysteine desulfurase n=1 Tax=Candidatus Uhrbacteria bacterium CG_4_10_14_0_8_um_filter_58_22 TaxID=1975029 RepID=A0A2M7QA30_9BACT|nr:MAG: hypothetical protein AUJ19_04770 [Parcubacteria group bacterium CG1_02_58_44]PIY62039.1 MAG: cysteine desulfurase NifS [Candidatus Uhrbacteria bacterium CG_4_10_14_0_8_um_filter_58_22]